MINAGDLFKNAQSGEVFKVKSISSGVVLLATRDGFHSMFVRQEGMESDFLPFVEDEPAKKNPSRGGDRK